MNIRRLRERTSIELLFAVVIAVGGLSTAVFHTVASRQVLDFDCGSPLTPVEFDVDGTPQEQLRATQCDHELDEARESQLEAVVFTIVSLSILWLVTVLDRSGSSATEETDGGAETEEAEPEGSGGQAESDP